VKTLFLFLPLVLYAQSDAGLSQGRALFRGNCAFCHGLTAEGGRGPNLVSAPLHHGEADADLKSVILNGVPGATMPSFSEMPADDVDNLVLYLRSLSRGVVKRKTVPGDPQQGRAVYAKNGCPACHRIGNEGSVYGPDLTRIGSSRSLEYLRESLVNPTADIQPEYEGVTAVTKDGRRIVGVRINEDTFTLQLRTPAQKFVSFSKDGLREVVNEKKSLMPAYDRLSPADLENLVAYLAGQTGTATGAVKESETKR
jgi:cytochrome c oxidase cbb3-type subunit 3